MKVRWWQRLQVEIGGRWQLVPGRDMTWKDWAWSSFARLTWPGKSPISLIDVPEGEIFGGIDSQDNKTFEAMIWWAAAGIRICGLDVGIGLFFRPQKSVEKIEKHSK